MNPFARKTARRTLLWLLGAAAVPTAAQPKPAGDIMERAAAAGIEAPAAPEPAALVWAETRRPAPNFALATIDGRQVELASLQGKVVLLEFWASWCGPCRAAMPQVIAIHNQYAAKGLVVLAINVQKEDERDDVKAYLAQNPVPFRVPFDPSNVGPVIRSYGVENIPTSVVVNKDGTLALWHSPFDGNAVSAAIEAALKK